MIDRSDRPEPHLIPPPPVRGRFWGGLGASVVLHLVAMATVVIARREPPAREPGGAASPPVEQVDMVYLPPPPAAPPPRPAQTPPRPEPEPVPVPEQMPRPQVERGPDLPEDVAVRPDPPPPDLPRGAAEPERDPGPPTPELASAAPVAPSPAAAAAPTMESEAQRLFGTSRRAQNSRGPIPAESWASAMTEDRENDCRPGAVAPRAPGQPPEMGFVAGKVYREGTHEPLVGAHLQIIGTPYSAFSNEAGEYRLLFDKALIDRCRTQYVQVIARGFAPRRLILGLGPRAQNDIPLSRRAM